MFKEKFARAAARNASLLCVGLDPERIPPEHVVDFNKAVIEATSDLVCAYKPNLALYEAMGVDGITALEKTLKYIPSDIPTIGDGKRGDIGPCGEAYATRLFRDFGFDAVTVNPYMGPEALEPFLKWKNKATFVLCKTSNARSGRLQDVTVLKSDDSRQPFFLEVVQMAQEMGVDGLVVGATFPDEIEMIRRSWDAAFLLIPGIGAQGGSLERAVRAAMSSDGDRFILSVSRHIIYASGEDMGDFTPSNLPRISGAARKAAQHFRDRINQVRELAPV